MYAGRRLPRFRPSACAALLLAACGGGDGPTDPLREQPGVRAVLGAGVTDTIEAQPVQALVAEVRGADGQPARGVLVRFEAQPHADTARRYRSAAYVCALTAPTCGPPGGFDASFASDTTDARGRAAVTVRLGQVAGRAVVRLAVPELGLVDSATFAVTPGSAARVRAAAADTALDIGATATLRGRVVDRYDNTRPETATLAAGAGGAIAVDAATGVVTGREMGTQWLFARHATFTDSTRVRVVPGGRLVVWDAGARVVRLVNLNGSGTRTLVSGVASDLGTFPRFDAARQRVTLHAGTESYGGPTNTVIVVDTSGAPRRDIGPAAGFTRVLAARQLADGTVLVAGRRVGDPASAADAVWRVATDGAVTLGAALPALVPEYGGVDISHDGTRVAYVASAATSGTELRVLTLSDGATTVLEPNARSPRWSAQGDRVALLVPVSGSFSGLDGVAVVVNADGTGRRALGSGVFSPGLAWSPDGMYVVGRATSYQLRLLRVSDGAELPLAFRSPTGGFVDYYQPDWR